MTGKPTERSSVLREALLNGRQQLHERFDSGSSLSVRAGASFGSTPRFRHSIYRLRSGWACQYSGLTDSARAIIDVYLPGDLIGIDARFRTRPVENVVALSAVETEAIEVDNLLDDLLASHCSALYVAWLLGWRQRRSDRLLTALSRLDARGRLGMMMLDFYTRLRTRRLIVTKQYNMPLTQQHIGEYLGLTVVHVNRVLRSLRADRIVSLERSCVTILDLEGLARLAGARQISQAPDEQPANPGPPTGKQKYDLIGGLVDAYEP